MPNQPQTGRTQVGGPLFLALGSLAIGMALSYVVGANLPVTSAKESPHVAGWLTILTVVAFFVTYPGLVAALAWWTRRLQVNSPLYLRRAIWIGIASGILAIIVSWIVEDQVNHVHGWLGSEQGSNFLTGFIEEGMKLMLPLVLIGTFALGHVLTGFWAVFTSAATFGLIEGAMSYIAGIYDPNPPTPGYTGGWVQAINGLNISGEVHHILYTAPAAALIWFTAAHFSKGKAWAVGIGAFLVAGGIHAFNDAVLAFYLDGGANAIYVSFAFGVLLLFTWYLFPVHMLRPPMITAQSTVNEEKVSA